jgi:hypothetical protein
MNPKPSGESALHLVAQRGLADVAAALVLGGCCLNATDNNGNNPKTLNRKPSTLNL